MSQRCDVWRLLQQVADEQPDPLAIKDANDRFAVVNHAFATRIGLSIKDMVGMPAEKVLQKPMARSLASSINQTLLRDTAGALIGTLEQVNAADRFAELKRILRQSEASLKRQETQLTAIDGIMARMVSSRELRTLFLSLADGVVALSGADNVSIFMVHESGETLTCVAGVNASQPGGKAQSISKPSNHAATQRFIQDSAYRAWRTECTLYRDGSKSKTRQRQRLSTRARVCAVPLQSPDGIMGILTACVAEPAEGSALDLPIIEKVAAMGSMAIANMRLMTATRAELRRTRALSELNVVLSNTSGSTASFDTVCKLLLSAIDVTRAVICMINESDTLDSPSAWSMSAKGLERCETLPATLPNQTICDWCCRTGEPATILRHAQDSRESHQTHDARRRLRIGSTACMPIITASKTIGAVVISRDRSRRDLSESELTLFHTIVNQLAAALERHELTSALQHQALHDSLTRLPNRRYFHSMLETSVAEAAAGTQRSAILFIDLNGFKGVNDSLGHASGDELLRQVGERLANCVRDDDVLARMGGDEFALIARGMASPEVAIDLAQRCAVALSTPFDLDGESASISGSIGISHFKDAATSADELLHQADLAMYDAKSVGGGAIRVFDELPATASTNGPDMRDNDEGINDTDTLPPARAFLPATIRR